MPKPVGRPSQWITKIVAPDEALLFYEALSAALKANAFDECHVYHGALNALGVPVLKLPNTQEVVPLPWMIGHYLGDERTGRRKCETIGCCNFTHYEEEKFARREKLERPPEIDTGVPTTEDLTTIIEYVRDKNCITKPLTLAEYREMIPEEDLSDSNLAYIFKSIKPEWRSE